MIPVNIRFRLVTGFIASFSGTFVYSEYIKNQSIGRATEMVKSGYVDVEGFGVEAKDRHWKALSLHLKNRWAENKYTDANPDDDSTWGEICKATQKFYSITTYPNEPKLSELKSVQLVYIALFDPKFSGKVHFGAATHPFVKFLINPFWAVGIAAFEPSNSLILGGGFGWKLPRFPTCLDENKEPRLVHENGWHTDQHTHRYLRNHTLIDTSLDIEEAALQMFVHMAGSVFYCATPGELTAENGVPGLIKSKHLEILQALGYHAARMGERSNISAEKLASAIQMVAPSRLPKADRQSLKADSIRCLTAVSAHVVVLPSKPMPLGRVRVLQNPKIEHCKGTVTLADIPANAPIRLLIEAVKSGELIFRSDNNKSLNRSTTNQDEKLSPTENIKDCFDTIGLKKALFVVDNGDQQ